MREYICQICKKPIKEIIIPDDMDTCCLYGQQRIYHRDCVKDSTNNNTNSVIVSNDVARKAFGSVIKRYDEAFRLLTDM